MLIDLSKYQIVSLSDLDLEKAAFKHGYYTHLVPKKILGKDGVERIHWVSPEAGKKTKLTRITHFAEGEEKGHHAEIQADHEIDTDAIMRFSAGDKVKTTYGKEKGREGVFRGSLQGDASPRVSVMFLDAKTGKYASEALNVNHIALVHRADPETSKVVERKTVEVTNLKGETTLVWLSDVAKPGSHYAKTAEEKAAASLQAKAEKVATTLEQGGVYDAPGGKRLAVKTMMKTGEETKYEVTLTAPGVKDKTGNIEAGKLQRIIKEKGFRRIPRAAYGAAEKEFLLPMTTVTKMADGTEVSTGSWVPQPVEPGAKSVMDVGENSTIDQDAGRFFDISGKTPMTLALMKGDLHKKGHFPYDDFGARTVRPEDHAIALEILKEHWPMLESTVAYRIGKWDSVSEGSFSASDILPGLISSVASYEPLLDINSTGLAPRLRGQADNLAKSKCEVIDSRERSMVRDDFVRDPSDTGSKVSVADKAAMAEWETEGQDSISAAAFFQKPEAIALDEGMRDEADLMSWLYEDETIRDVMMRWTGVGVIQASIDKKTAAAELVGYAHNPRTMEPYSQSTIETYLLPKELERVTEAFQAEGKAYPEFLHTLKSDLSLRNQFERKRKYGPVDPQDAKVEKVKIAPVMPPASRSNQAASLIRLGVPVKDVPMIMQVGDRVMSGQIRPGGSGKEYLKTIPMRLWSTAPAALTNWFRERSGGTLPSHLDFEAPFKEAMETERYKTFMATGK